MQRANRLRSSADFRRVRGHRRSWAHPLAILYVAPNEVGQPRVGISVNRKVGKAVVRNRVRRRIREAVRLHLGALGSGADLLFIAREPSAAADWPMLRAAVDELLRRARLLPGRPRAPKGAS